VASLAVQVAPALVLAEQQAASLQPEADQLELEQLASRHHSSE
jgi:hypothetical protein